MPPPLGASRIVLSGRLPGGEIWSSGFWMADTGVDSDAEASALANVIGGTLNASDASGAMRTTMIRLATAGTYWDRVMAYSYLGESNDASYIGEWSLPSPFAGQGNGGAPDQTCLVLSLRTELPGRRYRGRMFLPATGASFLNAGEASTSDTDVVATAWATAFTDINASDAGKVVVVSAAASAATPVQYVLMDTRADIQRRRANKETINAVSRATVTP